MTNEQLALITSDPQVLHGQANVAGTRVTVSVVLDCLAASMSEAEILAESRPSRRRESGRLLPTAPRWPARSSSPSTPGGEGQAR